jgi:hypothetical protein
MSASHNTQPIPTPAGDVEPHLTSLKLAFMAQHYLPLAAQAAQHAWSHPARFCLAAMSTGTACSWRNKCSASFRIKARFCALSPFRVRLTSSPIATSNTQWKRNKKVASKPQLRRRTGAHRNMALVARCAHRSDLLEAGARPEERTSTTLCAHAHARPHPRRSVSRLALPAPLDGHAWYTVPPCVLHA